MADPRPVNGTIWGEWVRAGSERWEVVRRSWAIFVRNTNELIELLDIPTTNVHFSLLLMGDDRETTAKFWEELDQRLHNQLASVVSLTDHTRRLLAYYEADIPAFVDEYKKRNDAIRNMTQASFLRDLRNYLVHYGTPPVIQSMSLGPVNDSGEAAHSVKLSAPRLLAWNKWSSLSKCYLSSFADRDGPVIRTDVTIYANSMSELFTWLFEQRIPNNQDENALKRFRIDS